MGMGMTSVDADLCGTKHMLSSREDAQQDTTRRNPDCGTTLRGTGKAVNWCDGWHATQRTGASQYAPSCGARKIGNWISMTQYLRTVSDLREAAWCAGNRTFYANRSF